MIDIMCNNQSNHDKRWGSVADVEKKHSYNTRRASLLRHIDYLAKSCNKDDFYLYLIFGKYLFKFKMFLVETLNYAFSSYFQKKWQLLPDSYCRIYNNRRHFRCGAIRLPC